MSIFTTSSPAVRRGVQALVEHVAYGQYTSPRQIRPEIIWLRSSETQLQFMHGGEVLKTGETLTDWSGHFSSIDEALEGVPDMMARFGIDTDSSLELVLWSRVVDTPAMENAQSRADNRARPNGRRTYAHIPKNWTREVVLAGDETHWPRLEEVTVAEAVTWSSRKSADENARSIEVFKGQWAIPLVQQLAHVLTGLPVEEACA